MTHTFRCLCLIGILVAIPGCDQREKYPLGGGEWNYTIPPGYILRPDNFENEMNAGSEEMNSNGIKTSDKPAVTLAISKSSSTSDNSLFASYNSPKYILDRGLVAYSNYIATSFKELYESRVEIFEIKKEDTKIGGSDFRKIESIFYQPNGDLLGGSIFYIGMVFEKEFSIVIRYNNQDDRNVLEQSVLTSTFIN